MNVLQMFCAYRVLGVDLLPLAYLNNSLIDVRGRGCGTHLIIDVDN